jgi:hypothetical protein
VTAGEVAGDRIARTGAGDLSRHNSSTQRTLCFASFSRPLQTKSAQREAYRLEFERLISSIDFGSSS